MGDRFPFLLKATLKRE